MKTRTQHMRIAILLLIIFSLLFNSSCVFNNVRQVKAHQSEVKSDDYYEVYRLYNPNLQEHFYTTSDNEKSKLTKLGWVDEGSTWLSPKNPHEDSFPVYRLYNKKTGRHLFTPQVEEKDYLVSKGWEYEKIAFYTSCGLTFYRYLNPKNGDHLFTYDENEISRIIAAGWIREKITIHVRIVEE